MASRVDGWESGVTIARASWSLKEPNVMMTSTRSLAFRARVNAVPNGKRARKYSARSISPRAFVPTVVPNPNARDDDDGNNGAGAPTIPNVERAVASSGWSVGAERGYDDDPHVFKIFKTRDGHAALEALQGTLRANDERGCRIRRETQTLYYMCCDGVRVRLNEGKKEVVVEIPFDDGVYRNVGAYVEKTREIEETIKNAGKKRRG